MYEDYITAVEPVIASFNEEYYLPMHNIVNTIWDNFIVDKTTCTTTQLDKINNLKIFNKLLVRLSNTGWVISDVNANYAYLDIAKDKVPADKLIELRIDNKFLKYKLTNYKTKYVNKAKRGSEYYTAKFNRKGFQLSGNYQYTFDKECLIDNLEEVAHEVMKDIATSIKDVTYQDMIVILLDYYATSNEWYNLDDNISDSRGRAIFQCTKKIFNPISSKVARALLQTKPKKLSKQSEEYVYLFIAELFKCNKQTLKDRILFGIDAYKQELYPDSCSLDKRLWLSRIYNGLTNNRDNWDIPISVDGCSNMLQIIGCLTNNHEYLDGTNLIGTKLKDMWSVDGVPRNHVKKACTPYLYGSSADIAELWSKNSLDYTNEQLSIMEEELTNGSFASANKFKDFIIGNGTTKELFTVKIGDEEVEFKCNRFSEKPITSSKLIYTTSQRVVKPVNIIERGECNLELFKLYLQTGLIHNIDSQIMNKVCLDLKGNFIPIHDAMICHPSEVHKIKQSYRNHMYDVYLNRVSILNNYCKSISIEEELINQFVKDNNIEGNDIKKFNLTGLL